MGIKRLNNFLTSYDALKYHNNIGDFIRSFKNDGYKCFNTRNKPFVIGIDLMLYAHKYEYSCGSIYPGFINQILNFMSNQILPIYIIDGTAPIEKSDVINSRNIKKNKINDKIFKLKDKLNNLPLEDNEKNKILNQISKLNKSNINITSTHIYNLTKLFDIFNIPYIRANGEADTLISALYKNNIIDACLSEDMDILVFGCKKMIKFKSSKIVEYDLDYILNKINLNYNQFIELCILFGCDYLKPLLRDKPDIIYNKYKNADNILDLFENNNSNIINQYIDDFNITKRIFIDSYNKEKIPYIKTEIKEINIDDLYAFINNHCNYFSNTNIKYQISHINYLIKNNKFTNITIY
jgi:5'-3' exonuclease